MSVLCNSSIALGLRNRTPCRFENSLQSSYRARKSKAISVKVSSSANEIAAAAAAQSIAPEITWQAAVGALAGVTPFVIAGIEFGKRIRKQKQCSICKGSGLVKKGKYYFRCYGCGGFLPWQSWKRFLSG
eukprot:TRINITY_DN30233_c0_g1_i1.p1 TRINITY_DN30233_c0_g1~~TRINITY_DN30233_c0_g1_i1.p1  ORF type:complete len:130 (+),score=20.22 TRINITY_DN30233_c0_g1_i1:133-522(+)